MLRSLLTYAKNDDSVARLVEEAHGSPQRAFVSASLRPYLLASLLDAEPERPALIVAGDDRAARDLAADLKAFLAPRPVRFYPARGMRYESHLAPPPHLVGLRIAALDSLLASDGERGRARHLRRRRSPRRSPIPTCARTASRSRRAACSTSTRPRTSSWPAATSASTRSRTAASSRSAATSSTSTRPPRSAPCAASCSTWRSSASPGSPPSPSARSRRPSGSRSRRRPSSAPEHRELAEIAAATEEDERPDIAEVLPVERFRELLDLVPDGRARGDRGRGGAGACAARLLGGRDHQLPRRGRPPPVREAGGARRGARRARAAAPVEHLPGPAARVPGAVRRHGGALAARRRAGAREARPLRLPHVRGLGAPRGGRARPAQHGPHAGGLPRRQAGAGGPVADVRPRQPARRLHRTQPEAGRAARAPPAAAPPRRAPPAGAAGAIASLHRPARRVAGGARGPRHRAASRASRRRPSAA